MRNFKKGTVVLSVVLSSQLLVADTFPVGSYQKSCKNITVKSNVLSANCEKLNGNMQLTSLDNLDSCLNSINQDGDIGNIDGNLICLPDLPKVVNDFTFPKSETKLNDWVYSGDLSNIYKHAWGIWAGLTSFVGKVDGSPVRAFETWNTVSNMLYQIESTKTDNLKQLITPKKEMKLDLMVPNQFRNIKTMKGNLANAIKEPTTNDGDTNIFVSVAYNPPAAKHAISNRLFLQSTLNKYLQNGYSEIPTFPYNAITIKPVYKVIPKDVKDGIYKFPGWPGTPVPAKAFPEKDWNSCVYVDINGVGEGGNSIDEGCKGQTRSSTFYLNNFIHNKIDRENANFLSNQLGLKVSEGDYAILVGMHVTTREMKRWTWQTYWWSANADNPYSPSTKEIADTRPSVLDKTARHYAMSVTYQMVSPAQPITKGKNVGSSFIGYNPHLEAGFDTSVFQIVKPINGTIKNEYGVQTNCMTCHNLALYDPKVDYTNHANREKPYGTDYYMSLDDETFNNKLRLDFAWSIVGFMKLDDNK